MAFSDKRYLAIGGNQLTIWEDVTLNEGAGAAHAWFNVHSAVMPRAFVEVRFSPCEQLFATTESMVSLQGCLDCLFITCYRTFHFFGFGRLKVTRISNVFIFYFLSDKSTGEKGVHSKTVRFAYLPKYSNSSSSFYWTQLNGRSILCTTESDSSYFWDFLVTETSIKSILIYECMNDSTNMVPIRNPRPELNLINWETKQLRKLIVEDWRQSMCDHIVECENIKIDENALLACQSSAKAIEISNTDGEAKFLVIGRRHVCALTMDKFNYQLKIDKSWTFRIDSIKIIYESSGIVLFLDVSGRLCSTDWSHQSSIHQISEELFLDMAVIKSDSQSVILVTGSSDKTELLKLSCDFKDITERVELLKSRPLSPIYVCNNRLIIRSDTLEIYQFWPESDMSSILASKISVECDSPYFSLVGDSLFYLEKDRSQFSISNSKKQTIRLQVADSSFNSDHDIFGSLTYLGANSKSLFGSSVNVFDESGHLVHLCRNSFGNVLDIKHFNSSDIDYFLCLNNNALLIFTLNVTKAGTIEPFLLKSIALPAGEFSSSRCSISITGDYRIFIRNECNAYEIILQNEISQKDWSKNTLDCTFKLLPSVLGVLQGQVIDDGLINLICYNTSDVHSELLKEVLQMAMNQQQAMDQSGLNSLISILLYVKAKDKSISLDSLGNLKSFGLVSALRSDSQLLLIEQCLALCQEKITFEWFELFQFGFWVKNFETLVNMVLKMAFIITIF